jgi:hypothetical protein
VGQQGSLAVLWYPPVGRGLLGALGAWAVDVEGVEVVRHPLMASVTIGALGVGSFWDLLMPGERQEKQERVGSWWRWRHPKEATYTDDGCTDQSPAGFSFLLAPSLPTGIPVGRGSPAGEGQLGRVWPHGAPW